MALLLSHGHGMTLHMYSTRACVCVCMSVCFGVKEIVIQRFFEYFVFFLFYVRGCNKYILRIIEINSKKIHLSEEPLGTFEFLVPLIECCHELVHCIFFFIFSKRLLYSKEALRANCSKQQAVSINGTLANPAVFLLDQST